MRSGIINDITNLHFFTDRGYELQAQKDYILTWEIFPNAKHREVITENPKGYFIGDIDLTRRGDAGMRTNSLVAGIIHGGQLKCIQPTADQGRLAIDTFFDPDNILKVTVNIQQKRFTHTCKVSDVWTGEFESNDSPIHESHRVYVGDGIDGQEYYEVLSIIDTPKFKMREADQYFQEMPHIQYLFQRNIPNIGLYFPFVTYSMDFYQDKISQGFIQANTIFVMEEQEGQYTYPHITSSNPCSLVFKPMEEGELFLISTSDNCEVKKLGEVAFSLADDTNKGTVTPISFAIGVQADVEGAYANPLGMYIRTLDDPDGTLYFLGFINFKTQVVGEDERFRTLLENFGVPDPKQYSQIFAEQDYQEQGEDFQLINKKSKELFMSYSDIFSYVGTYKALLNAIKFLGYQDIVFKEWYTFKDTNDTMTDLAIQVYDSSTGEYLKNKFAQIGVSVEDFKSYNKLNKLSMVYHYNEMDEDGQDWEHKYLIRRTASGEAQTIGDSDFLVDVPMTKPIYTYRNDEIMAKLFSVKSWLEKHVIGVNAYISDITGEGIYLGIMKTQGYSTQHALADFSDQQYCTPTMLTFTDFVKSRSTVTCTLNELNNAVCIQDCWNLPFQAFVKGEMECGEELTALMPRYDKGEFSQIQGEVVSDFQTFRVSNTIESPVLADEYDMQLTCHTHSGTLHEWCDEECGDIFINDGEIDILQPEQQEVKFTHLPIITLENANLHATSGDWRKNVAYTIHETINQNTGDIVYKCKDMHSEKSYAIYQNGYYVLTPGENASLIYTTKNKWNIPMFIMKNYILNTEVQDGIAEGYKSGLNNGEFVLEIIKGDMLFTEIKIEGEVGMSAQLSFSNDEISHTGSGEITDNTIQTEQEVMVSYTYSSDKEHITRLDRDLFMRNLGNEVQTTDLTEEIGRIGDRMLSYYQSLAETHKAFITLSKINYGYREAKAFLDSQQFADEMNDFLRMKAEQRIQERMYRKVMDSYEKAYIINKTQDIMVNRAGEYQLTAKTYDRYNNIYANRYDNTFRINVMGFDINTYSSVTNSGNLKTFYPRNVDGKSCDTDCLNGLYDLALYNTQPKYPKNYTIYDIDYDSTSNTLEFDNLTYAIDTPKNNYYVVLDNYTEEVSDLSVEGVEDMNRDEAEEYENETGIALFAESMTVTMRKENPDRLNIFVPHPNKQVMVCAIDITDGECVACCGPYHVTSVQDCELTLDISGKMLLSMAYRLQDMLSTHKIYLLDASEYEVEPRSEDLQTEDSDKFYYSTDRVAHVTTLYKKGGDQLYNYEDVVKIRYTIDEREHLINETTYRIMSVHLGPNSTWEYTLNGMVSDIPITTPIPEEEKKEEMEVKEEEKEENVEKEGEEKEEEKKEEKEGEEKEEEKTEEKVEEQDQKKKKKEITVRMHIMRASQVPVHYSARVVGDAYEYTQNITENLYVIRDSMQFNGKVLSLDNYIDDTYSARVYDYDMDNLRNIWTPFYSTKDDIELFEYNNHPITITQGNKVFFEAVDSKGVFDGEPQCTLWRWSNLTFDDVDNWDGHTNSKSKEVLFRSMNTLLGVAPEYLGAQDIQLICIDRYGNMAINEGEGILYVKDASADKDK